MMTEQEVVAYVNEMWATHPMLTRNVLKKQGRVSMVRLEKLASEGLIKLPKKVSKRMCHLYNDTSNWRNFKLRGSPTRRATNG